MTPRLVRRGSGWSARRTGETPAVSAYRTKKEPARGQLRQAASECSEAGRGGKPADPGRAAPTALPYEITLSTRLSFAPTMPCAKVKTGTMFPVSMDSSRTSKPSPLSCVKVTRPSHWENTSAVPPAAFVKFRQRMWTSCMSSNFAMRIVSVLSPPVAPIPASGSRLMNGNELRSPCEFAGAPPMAVVQTPPWRLSLVLKSARRSKSTLVSHSRAMMACLTSTYASLLPPFERVVLLASCMLSCSIGASRTFRHTRTVARLGDAVGLSMIRDEPAAWAHGLRSDVGR